MVGLALRLKPSRREGSWSIGATAYGRLRCLYFKGVNAGVEWAKSFRMLVTIWGTPVGVGSLESVKVTAVLGLTAGE